MTYVVSLPLTTSSPFNHRIDTSRCYGAFNILLSVIGRSKRIPDDQPTPRILLSKEQISTLLSQPPQCRRGFWGQSPVHTNFALAGPLGGVSTPHHHSILMISLTYLLYNKELRIRSTNWLTYSFLGFKIFASFLVFASLRLAARYALRSASQRSWDSNLACLNDLVVATPRLTLVTAEGVGSSGSSRGRRSLFCWLHQSGHSIRATAFLADVGESGGNSLKSLISAHSFCDRSDGNGLGVLIRSLEAD